MEKSYEEIVRILDKLDMTAVAWPIDSSWIPSDLVPSPTITDQVTWSVDPGRHPIRQACFVDRDAIYRDFFTKLENAHR